MRILKVTWILVVLSACTHTGAPSNCTPQPAVPGKPDALWKPIGFSPALVPGVEAQMMADMEAGGVGTEDAQTYVDGYIESGSTAPSPVQWESSQALRKIVPTGQKPSPYSGYWTTPTVIQAEALHPEHMADDFALPPSTANASEYDVYEIAAMRSTEVFVSVIAPTFDAATCKREAGGELQILVMNRHLFGEPKKVGTIIFSKPAS